MKYLNKFNNFDKINEEESWKEILLGLLSLVGVSGMSQNRPSDGDRRVYRAKTEQSMKNMVRQGWTLDSVQVDTLWKEVLIKKPDTLVMVTKLSFDKDQYFESGKFVLSQDVKDSISSTLNDISGEGGVITDIRVESSTDKQGLSINLQKQLKDMGYSGDNKGLSKARSEAVTNYMTSEMGINDTLIESTQKYEMGDETIDQSARYVNVDIAYLVINQEVTPGKTVDTPQLKKTYFLSTTNKVTNPPHKFKRGHNKKTVKMGPIKHHKNRKSVVARCNQPH